jgi:antitoxin PrlF
MLKGRIWKDGRTILPRPVLEALDLRRGDIVAYALDGDRAIMTKAVLEGPRARGFHIFVEWDSDADHRAYDKL